jgi:hypothetical protein
LLEFDVDNELISTLIKHSSRTKKPLQAISTNTSMKGDVFE